MIIGNFEIKYLASDIGVEKMDEQAMPEEEPILNPHTDSQVEPTDSGVSSSVASDDSVLKHGTPQGMNGGSVTHTAELHNSSTLSGSLHEGLERTELLLTANPSLGLSAASLEVMTSGEQLNLLAEGLESPDGSISGTQEEEDTKNECGAQCKYERSVDMESVHVFILLKIESTFI